MVEDGVGIFSGKELLHTKVGLELHVGPVVERVAQGVGHRLGPLLKLLPGRSIAGDVALIDAICAHGPPLVMVAGKPNFRNVAEAVVARYMPGREVAMVVDDGQTAGIAVIETPGLLRL